MPRTGAPDVELSDVRSWEKPLPDDDCRYLYSVEARPGQGHTRAHVEVVWRVTKDVSVTLCHAGETLVRGRPGDITGAWIRAAARLHASITPGRLTELKRLALWNNADVLRDVKG